MKKYRDETNLFLVEGEHLVLEAYKKGVLKELIVEENTNFKLDIETRIKRLKDLATNVVESTYYQFFGTVGSTAYNKLMGQNYIALRIIYISVFYNKFNCRLMTFDFFILKVLADI